MGLTSLLLGPTNPLSAFVGANKNTIRGIGSGLASGRTFQEGLSHGAQYAAQGGALDDQEAIRQQQINETADQKNATVQAMLEAGREDLANMAEAGQMAMAWKLFAEAKQAEMGGGDPSGFQPIPGTINGQPAYIQADKAGNVRQLELPEGFTPQARFDKRDLGTHIRITDTVTGQTWDEPKENFGAAYDTAAGGAQGKIDVESRAQAPQAVANADTMLAQIDGVLNDPNLGLAVGLGGIAPAIPGTAQAGVVAKIDQLQGQAFLQAFESLKGGGQITQIEGEKATNAIARLQRTQNLDDFKAALGELRDIVAAARERAQQKAGGIGGTTSTGLPWSIVP